MWRQQKWLLCLIWSILCVRYCAFEINVALESMQTSCFSRLQQQDTAAFAIAVVVVGFTCGEYLSQIRARQISHLLESGLWKTIAISTCILPECKLIMSNCSLCVCLKRLSLAWLS